ncbi:MAG TPA: Rho termination factor N-terminal domain-containing protein [Solirubrobacterales bacterium]|nr:Rho termination factor N-terminal domain-containing protein [Solirubrobacterales bacterium]
MTKAELESKHLSELHQLAAEAGVPKFRMLTRSELIEQLAEAGGEGAAPKREAGGAEAGERPRRRRRNNRRAGSPAAGEAAEKTEKAEKAEEPEAAAEPEKAEPPRPERPRTERPRAERPSRRTPVAEPDGGQETEARPRRRRRRRFGRRGKQGVTLQAMLLPPEAGRQALLCAETREACTDLLRGVAADLSADSKGPEPVVLLIDPSPEELADWKREAPQAEIVSAGQPRHADDALAQAKSRAAAGDDVILLVDSLTRLAEAYGDADAAKDFFDAGRLQGAQGGGSLTVVAALERSAD